VNILREGWRDSEIACVRLTLGDRQFRTDNFRESVWMRSAPVTVHGSAVGRLEVGYLERRSEEAEGPFLEEEGLLLDAVAERLGHVIERRQAEGALRLTEFSINRVADMMSWISPAGRFLFVNDSLCRNLGYSREELLGLTVWDVDPNILDSWDERWLESKRSGSRTIESTHQTKSGEVRPVEVTTNFIEYEGQEYMVAFSRDVTERKRRSEKRSPGGAFWSSSPGTASSSLTRTAR
jgi:PAS domain S-box-containing protein